MRKGLIFLILLGLTLFGAAVNFCFTLITLLFEDCGADAIQVADIPSPNSTTPDDRPSLIPRIIHQTWVNETIPDRWHEAQKSCQMLHENFTYMLWTDERSRSFIAKEYPWFIKTFDAYPYPIQRADAIRYFVLNMYGGIYLDLDIGCNRPIDPLLVYPAWLRKTIPTGISNDAMGAIPKHPFFIAVLEKLRQYNRNWRVPYITVMFSTGPLFLSVVWKEYNRDRGSALQQNRVRILMPPEYRDNSWSFFKIYRGSSWHRGDARTIFWMGQHWILVTLLGISLGLGVILLTFAAYRRLALYQLRRRGWTKINVKNDS